MSDKEIIAKWYKMTSFLAAKDIPYLECEDGIYRPDFSGVAKDEATLGKMEDSYVKLFGQYIEVQQRYWKGELTNTKKIFSKKKHYEYD